MTDVCKRFTNFDNLILGVNVLFCLNFFPKFSSKDGLSLYSELKRIVRKPNSDVSNGLIELSI